MSGGGFRLVPLEETGEGRRFRVELPAASPLFAGHFPGHPILPGVAHLAIVQHALGAPLAGVRNVKLRRPVAPGEELELWLAASREDGSARFELIREGAAVSAGVALVASLAESGDPEPAPAGSPAGDLLPHAPPARFIRAVLETREGGIAAVAEVPPDHPLVEDGRFPAFLGLEAAAQAAAILEAMARREGEPPGPRIGYLVGIREARFTAPSLPAGRPFRVATRFQGGAFPLSIYEVEAAGAVTGTLSTYITRDE